MRCTSSNSVGTCVNFFCGSAPYFTVPNTVINMLVPGFVPGAERRYELRCRNDYVGYIKKSVTDSAVVSTLIRIHGSGTPQGIEGGPGSGWTSIASTLCVEEGSAPKKSGPGCTRSPFQIKFDSGW
jgi:hypothetical protein